MPRAREPRSPSGSPFVRRSHPDLSPGRAVLGVVGDTRHVVRGDASSVRVRAAIVLAARLAAPLGPVAGLERDPAACTKGDGVVER